MEIKLTKDELTDAVKFYIKGMVPEGRRVKIAWSWSGSKREPICKVNFKGTEEAEDDPK